MFPGLGSLESSFFNAPKTLRSQTSLKKTIKTIGVIEEAVVIVALAA